MFVNDRTENVVHHGLEGRRGVCQPKKHYHWFKDSMTCLECCFELISITDSYVVVSPSYVKCGVDECFGEVCNGLGDEGKWCVVWNGMLVKVPIVLDRA